MSRGLDCSRVSGGEARVDLLASRGEESALRSVADGWRTRSWPTVAHGAVALGCFVLLVVVGWILLSASGVLKAGRMSALDALLLTCSAVTLTGLSAVPISELSAHGQTLLLVLFQIAGMAIIAFSSVHLAAPGIHHARGSRQVVRQRWLEVEQMPGGRLLAEVVVVTLALEAIGALVLYVRLQATGIPGASFSALFLAASAFCNAGFIPGGQAAGAVAADGVALAALMALICLGGLGYLVLRDLGRRLLGAKKSLDLHTRIVLCASAVLTCLGAGLLFLLAPPGPARNGAGSGRLLASLFEAVSARTAGFAVAEARQSPAANAVTVLLMLVGGAPGSAAGGLKVTSVVLALLVGLRGMKSGGGGLSLLGRKAAPEAVQFALLFVLRALLLLACCAFLLSATETLFNQRAAPGLGQLLFESVSAFSSAGVPSGLTAALSKPGKAVLALTMLIGRFGLLAMAVRMSSGSRPREAGAARRQGEVFFG